MAKQSFGDAKQSFNDSCKKRIDEAVELGIFSHEEGEKRKARYDESSTWVKSLAIAKIQVSKL